MSGRWAHQSWIDLGDYIRVIGNFNKDNEFHLKLDDNVTDFTENSKASMIIVEPHILIPTTQIVKAFPCVR